MNCKLPWMTDLFIKDCNLKDSKIKEAFYDYICYASPYCKDFETGECSDNDLPPCEDNIVNFQIRRDVQKGGELNNITFGWKEKYITYSEVRWKYRAK